MGNGQHKGWARNTLDAMFTHMMASLGVEYAYQRINLLLPLQSLPTNAVFSYFATASPDQGIQGYSGELETYSSCIFILMH
jgi:hypothetical protein